MGILVYDELWVREPRLMVPRMVPVGDVKINWSHPLAKNLKHCVVWNKYRPVDLIGNPLTYYSLGTNLKFGAGNAGPGLVSLAQNNTYVSIPMFSGNVTPGFSIVVHQHAPIRSTDAGWLRYGGSQHSHWTYNNAIGQSQGTGGNVWSGITPSNFDFEKELVIVMTSNFADTVNRHTVYVDGKMIKQSVSVFNFSAWPTYAHLCGCQSYKGYPGITYSNYAYTGELNQAQATELARDPYQFLIPA